MSKTIQLTVTSVQHNTTESVLVEFTSSVPLEFKAGQYITFFIPFEGEILHRSYSLSCAPHEERIQIGVKRTEGGRASSFLVNSVRVGDQFEANPPQGNFVLPKRLDQATHFVFFAAGSGITPVISMIKSIEHNSKNHQTTLFLGNRNPDSVMFKIQLDELDLSERTEIIHVYSQNKHVAPLLQGRISFGKTWELIEHYINDSLPKVFYICGPSGMMSSVQNALTDLGIDSDSVHREFFKNPGQDFEQKQTKEKEMSTFEGTSKIHVILDEEEFEFELGSKGKVILNAAMDAGADAPFSCKGGICTTCKAKLIEGKVEMDQNFALTDGEIAEGFILTCQSHPRSEKVVLSYDDV
jgi:ring-1,2-phenylacetyl-CoA epoxidase subunit PaaE